MLKEMSEWAFFETGVEELTVPSSVEVIGAGCFCHCNSLKSLEFESGPQLRRIEADSFAGAPLTEFELPNSIRFISGRAFDRKVLKSISIHSCPTHFRFRDGMLEDASGRRLVRYFGSALSLVIGRSVEMIGDACFKSHETLASVVFESDSILERIGESAFANGKLMGAIVLPRSVRMLARFCFCGCESLSSVRFESGSMLSEIGEFAFAQCGLTDIVIPASVAVIGRCAFSRCRSLASVTFESESNLRVIGKAAFAGCPCECKVKIPRLGAEAATETEK
jgi:hypothetical protein